MPRLSRRSESIAPFFVMELVKEAEQLERAGRSIVHLSIGEPDFTAPPPVVRAARLAIESGQSRYTSALGLAALRESISGFYRDRFGLQVDAGRIVVTAGASAALVLVVAALFDVGDEVLLPDPSYPCTRHIISAAGTHPRLLACTADARFQLQRDQIDSAWGPRSRGVLIASPSNPTGTSIDADILKPLADSVFARGGSVVVDEIYQCLTYDRPAQTALAVDERIVVINSFSKYFGMTGWRLGWIVAPPLWVPTFEKLSQNLFICASSVAQHAALACFEAASLALSEQRRQEFKRRRDFLVPALLEMGMDVPAMPDGAFYIYGDISAVARGQGALREDSSQFARRLLHEAGVCLVPGKDFGQAQAGRYVRLSYATSMEKLQEAVHRMQRHLRAG